MSDEHKNTLKRQKAVALEQQGDRQDIPKITASGSGKNAEKILRLAFDNDVKVRKDEELVEILSQFDVDSVIPIDALGVVSEILSHVYQENVKLDAERHKDFKGEEN